jgi:hypothetical protein
MAQTATSRLEGQVTDQSGAVIPGAKITVLNDKTRVSAETTSGAQGVFHIQTVVETTQTELVTHIDRAQILDLPSVGRNPFDFATQMAGVTSTSSATSGSSIMNGLRGSSNSVTQQEEEL